VTRIATVGLSLLMLQGSTGCAEDTPNYLEGSLTRAYQLEFSRTRARLYDSELAIEYLTGGGARDAQRVTLRITLANTNLIRGRNYDLLDEGYIGRSDFYGDSLPELLSGSLEMSSFRPEDGSVIAGDFEALFITPDSGFAVSEMVSDLSEIGVV